MKKRRFVPILAAAAAVAVALSGCGAEKKARAEVEKAVGEFMECALSLDQDGALACIDKDSAYYRECEENGAFGLSASNFDKGGIFDSQAFIDGIVDLTKKHSGYEITAVELNGKNEASAEATLSLPDYDKLDLTEFMSLDSLGFDMDDFLEYAQTRGYDSEAFVALPPEEGQELISEYMNSDGYKENAVSVILTAMDENVVEASAKASLSLKLIDGSWKITGVN